MQIIQKFAKWSIGLFSVFILIGFVQPTGAHAQSVSLCNSVVFSQLPNNGDLFLGRRLINTTSDGCSGTNWILSLFQMNWTTNQLSYLHDVLVPPFVVGSDTITTTYDPSVIDYNGELWVGFECAGVGGNLGGPSSSCIGPMSTSTYTIDASRVTIAIAGVPNYYGQRYSASVPKLFSFGGTPYVYWSVNHFFPGPNGQLLTDTTVRGAALYQESSGGHRLWAQASGGAPLPAVWLGSVEVMGNDQSSTLLDELADGFDVKVVNGRIVMTAGVGGRGCTTPVSPVYGCYRMQIRSSFAPLGQDSFNTSIASSLSLPFNPHEYSKFFVDPSGGYHIIGQFEDITTNGSPTPSPALARGIAQFPVDPPNFQYGTTDATPMPAPQLAGIYLQSRFTILQQFQIGCSATDPVPDQGNAYCYSAANRFCASQGYTAGGEMQEWSGDDVGIFCLTSSHASNRVVDVSTLNASYPSCALSNIISDTCLSATSSYCRSAGYLNGFSPMEIGTSQVTIVCVDGVIAANVQTTFTILSQQDARCTATSWTRGSGCIAAVHRYCQALGYAAGFGITDHYLDNAAIGCIRRDVPA